MAKPALMASPQGLVEAQQALIQAGWTQKHLASLVSCSRQPMTNFFKGEKVSQPIFIEICDRLGLNWRVIAGLTSKSSVSSPAPNSPVSKNPTSVQSNSSDKLDTLVQDLRSQVRPAIEAQCGTMRVLDMSHPMTLNDIYTSVNILEKISGRQYKQLDELLQHCEADSFERVGLGQVTEARIPGLEAIQTYQKVIILGKPGAGKTTFLKYLAMQCSAGEFEPKRAPIYVNLKDFAETKGQPELIVFILERLFQCDRSLPSFSDLHRRFLSVLVGGSGLLLLDGLDEVRAEDQVRVIQEIRRLSEQYWENHMVLTCRIAAWDYTFDKFTEVEIADFNFEQIESFAHKWFTGKQMKATVFIHHLKQNPRIQQLAFSPLLLTLVCLAFEESGDFPSSRSELYKEGIDALLKKWDAKRGIQRSQIYKKLSQQRKLDLLSQLALTTFQEKKYFFKQSYAEQFIANYIRHIPNVSEDLQLDSEAALHSIEAQHGLLVERAKGIYSFSHLTFQEYFAARELVFNEQSLEDSLQELLTHFTERRWREVFLLTTELLRNAAPLLIPLQARTNELLATSEKLQAFLQDICDRAQDSVFDGISPAAVRAFFFDVDFDIDENRTVALALDRNANLLVCASFLTRMLAGVTLKDAIALTQAYENQAKESEKITAAPTANRVMLIAIHIALAAKSLDYKERTSLRSLMETVNTAEVDDEQTKTVADQARSMAKSRYHIEQSWFFTPQEKQLLKQYYSAVKLIVDCLSSEGCMLSPEVRQQLNASLFTPVSTSS